MSSKTTGTVKWFNTAKGYGFAVNESGEDIFIHYRSIQAEGFKNLKDSKPLSLSRLSLRGLAAAEVEVLETA